MLRVDDVSVRLEGTLALDEADLAVAAGEVVTILGSSGSGKTTLLRVIAGLQHPDGGRVLLDGNDLGAFLRQGRDGLRREMVGVIVGHEDDVRPGQSIDARQIDGIQVNNLFAGPYHDAGVPVGMGRPEPGHLPDQP